MITVLVEDSGIEYRFTKYLFPENEIDKDMEICIVIRDKKEEISHRLNMNDEVLDYNKVNELFNYSGMFNEFQNKEQILKIMTFLNYNAPYLEYEMRLSIVEIFNVMILHELEIIKELKEDIELIITSDLELELVGHKYSQKLILPENLYTTEFNFISEYFKFINNCSFRIF